MSISDSPADRPGHYLARHWRGELPLAQAFWVNGVALTAALLGTSGLSLFGRSLTLIDSLADFVQLLLISVVTLLVIPVWQLRGLWQSAERHSRSVGTLLAGISAQVCVTLLALVAVMRVSGAAVDIAMMTPQALNTGIYRSDIDVLADGRELRIRGGFGFGVSARVAEKLAQQPGIRRLRLESWGGSLGEARQLALLIENHRLNTYSGVFCSNTCIIPFMAGHHRTIRGRSRIGLTRAYGLPVVAAAFFARRGVPREFLVSWNQIGPKSWYPTGNQLRQGRIVDTILSAPER